MRKIILSLIISLSLFFTITAGQVSAKVLTSPDGNVSIAANEVVDDDLFIGAQTATIDGNVNGDVFVGAQTVKVTGTIHGNLHAGANTVFLQGTVIGNVYAGGQSIIMNGGKVNGSLLVGGATVDIDEKSSVGGSVLAGAGVISINAPVKRNVFAGAGSLVLGPDTKIGKDLYYAVGEKGKGTTISSTAQIGGTIHKKVVETPKEEPKITKRQAVAAFSLFKIASTIVSFIAALIVGFIYMKFFHTESAKVKELVEKSFWKCFGIGFLLVIAFIPGLLFLAMTIIGIPLIGLILLLTGLYLYLAQIVMGSVAGSWLTRKFGWKISPYRTFVLGLAAICILKLVPFIGFLTCLLVVWTGVGAFTIRFFTKK